MKSLYKFFKKNLSIFCALLFFFVAVLTLKDYGTSWDETIHFSRGYVYLNFFLTGKKTYPLSDTRKSFYQLDYQTGDFFFKKNPGHPPLEDILAALFNFILYKKLAIVGDIHSYQLFIILISSFLVFITVKFGQDIYGSFAALVTYLVLVTYPLFFAESHFNIKDPVETTFFTACIYSFYKFLQKKSVLWFLLSSVFFGLGLGTKFNILFLPLIFIFYLPFRFKRNIRDLLKLKLNLKMVLIFFTGLSIALTIFVGTWPYLWNNFPTSLIQVFKFYENIGTGTNYQPNYFYLGGFNLFPLLWILFTTPPLVLTLSAMGIAATFINQKIDKGVRLLWLSWFLIPILRVTLPFSSIYGGSRQIMEFLPAMCLLSGLGAWQLIYYIRKLNNKVNLLDYRIFQVVLLLLFLWPSFILIKLHPNQNVYFNSLIGGLKGASERNFPSWGNSYGNGYFAGIKWINENVPLNSKVALIQGTESNTPVILFRPDIYLRNSNWSGLSRNGEYLMDLVFNDTGKAFYYTWEYTEKFLNPVYELKVDDVVILKIWKNDLEHTKKGFEFSDTLYTGNTKSFVDKNILHITFRELIILSRLLITFESPRNCVQIKDSTVQISEDNKNWLSEKDSVPFTQLGNKTNLENNKLTLYFAAKKAKFVRLVLNSDNSCLFNQTKIDSYFFDSLKFN